jgi:hypothetical protein
MSQKYDVVIVSAFGRGEWLASELKRKGLNAHLVDVSENLGRWSPEDAEGPFGLFQSDQLTQTQMARLDEEDASESVDEGFVLWLKSGPIDLRGTHSNYLLEKREIPQEVSEYVRNYSQLETKRKTELTKKIKAMPFYLNWFANFAHSLASPIHKDNTDYFSSGRPLAIFSPLKVRRTTRRGREKLTAWLDNAGVKTYNQAQLKDIFIDKSNVTSLEIQSEWSGVLKTDQLIWQLSSIETARLNKKISDVLYFGESLTPDWVWHRYRIDVQNSEAMQKLPLKMTMVDDLALPWTHANLLCVQKTASQDSLDVWCKTPETHRFQKNYHEQIAASIGELLQSRIPGAKAQILEYPQDYNYDEEKLGPARHVVYSAEKAAKLNRNKLANIHYDTPEVWRAIDWNGVFQRQTFIIDAIEKWKIATDKKIEKMNEKLNRKKGIS